MKASHLFPWIIISFTVILVGSCNKDEAIEVPLKPVITLDSETGVYKTKIGKPFSINPTVDNGEDAVYRWLSDSQIIGTGPTLTYTVDEAGAFYIIFRVTTPAGQDEKELRVDVGELAPPVISIAIPSGGLKVLTGEVYIIEPDIQNDENATYEWYEGTDLVGNQKAFSFKKEASGTYELTLKAINEDGSDEKTIVIEVRDEFSLSITFLAPLFEASPTIKSVFNDRGLFLRPIVENGSNPTYSWTIEGEGEVAQTLEYLFMKQTEGEYEVTFTITDASASTSSAITRNITRSGTRSASVTLNITVYSNEDSGIRVANGGSKKHFDKVYEYVPAPGQFVNDPTAGFAGESSIAAAAIYAQRRMENNLTGTGNQYVSLGGFGGYIVVGFDHSIENKSGYSGYDFSVVGNQFSGGSEPGIVWVMQDVNGNGLPDDEWYELKGSESDNSETIYRYAVTYFKPGGIKMNVKWEDNQGQSGTIDYWSAWHSQDYYYPAWVKTESYTLYGTRLKDKTYLDGGIWRNGDFDWGYADNWGTDRLDTGENADADPIKNYFKISNAIQSDGTPANLKYIDFIKVQTGVNAKADLLGEVSTEVYGFFDENLQ
jgi:hypothetical protein